MTRLLLSLIFIYPVLLSGEEFRIAASDLLADYIRKPLTEAVERSGDTVALTAIGSLPAMQGMRNNEYDMAIIAVPVDSEVPRERYNVFPFCYAIAVIVVNENNPLSEVSVRQLAGIYGTSQELNINSWGDLGMSGWGNRSVEGLAARSPNSISLELFKHTVISEDVFKPTVSVLNETEVESLIMADSTSIGVLSQLPGKPRVKHLLVSSDGPAFGPTPDNVHFGDYPIRLPFYLVVNQTAEANLGPVFNALFGPEVATALETNRLVALPDPVRRKYQVDFQLE